jgi:predicted DNA-binding transcriptional regulator AlpA
MSRRVLRPREAWQRLGIKHTAFYELFINTGKLRLVRLGPRAVGVVEDELDALIGEMITERDALPAD